MPVSARADNWVQVAPNGFGSANNTAVTNGITFNDGSNNYVYFGTVNSTDGAQVWRSSDGITWNQANTSGFDIQSSSNFSCGWVNAFNGAVFAGVGSSTVTAPNLGGRVYRSATGVSPWTVVFSTVTTKFDHNENMVDGPIIFNNNLYIGTKNAVTGAEIWRSATATAENSWTQVSTAGFGAGNRNSAVSAFTVYNNNLYAATGSSTPGSGQIWTTSDGSNWTQVLVASNTFDANTLFVSKINSFGGYFFAATQNNNGAQLWRTQTPLTGGWTQVYSADGDGSTRFAAASDVEIHALGPVGNFIYVGTFDSPSGARIYRSTDGAFWINSNAAGFGSAANFKIGGFVSTSTWLYASSNNNGAGGSVWRALDALPGAPTLNGVAIGTGSITWSWAPVTYADGYRVFSLNNLNLTGDLSPSIFSYTQYGGPLSTNTWHEHTVVAFNSVGNSTSALTSQIFTLANPSSGTMLTAVYGSSVALTWSPNTNPAGTNFAVQYWTAGGSTGTFSAGTSTSTTVTGLLGGTAYFLNVVSQNGNSIASAPDVTLSTVTQTLSSLTTSLNSNSGTTTLGVNMAGGLALVTIPGGSFSAPVTVTVQPPASLPATTGPAPAALVATGVGVEIDLSPSVQPANPVSITIPYFPASIVGLDPAKLLLARYDPLDGIWVPLPSVSNQANRTVSAATPHLSTFQIMAALPPGSVAGMIAYPNPLRPALGQPVMTFANVPASARIRIYDVAGELVKEIVAGSTGIAGWDATNRSGNPAASGVYFVLVQSSGQSKTYKVAVER